MCPNQLNGIIISITLKSYKTVKHLLPVLKNKQLFFFFFFLFLFFIFSYTPPTDFFCYPHPLLLLPFTYSPVLFLIYGLLRNKLMSIKFASYLISLISMCPLLISGSCEFVAVKTLSPSECSKMLHSPVLRPRYEYYLSLYKLRSSHYLNLTVKQLITS